MNTADFRSGAGRRATDAEGLSATAIFLLIGVLTLSAALLGIVTRQVGFLAAFWPANAILIGLFVRNKRLASPPGWLGAFAGFAIADLATGSSVTKMLLLTFGNFCEVIVGFIALSLISSEHRRLRQPFSILFVYAACVASGVGAAIAGIWPSVTLFDMPVEQGALTWFASALANSMAILPVVLAAPWDPSWSRLRVKLEGEARKAAPPFLFLIASLTAGLVVGGPAAITFPVPALLYCALVAGLFPTTVLNLISTAWTMVAITSTHFLVLGQLPPTRTILSVQIGLSLLAMGPIAVAANVATREEALRRLLRSAARDALTGVLTRGAFEHEAGDLLKRLAEQGRPVSVLMIDLDRFKEINDTYGHLAGDQALVTFAETAAQSLRDSDLFGRVGGEEFAILLPGAGYEIAEVVAERVRAMVEERAIEHEGDRFQITVSVGNSYFAHAPSRLEDALAAADEALYRAKKSGRNRVESYVAGDDEREAIAKRQ